MPLITNTRPSCSFTWLWPRRLLAINGSVVHTLVDGSKISAVSCAVFSAAKAIDADTQSYWATDDGVTTATLELGFGKEVEFNRFLAQEPIALGQRVKKFSLHIWHNGAYEPIAQQTTIGYKRLLRFPTVKTSKLKFTIDAAKACPAINQLAVYYVSQ